MKECQFFQKRLKKFARFKLCQTFQCLSYFKHFMRHKFLTHFLNFLISIQAAFLPFAQVVLHFPVKGQHSWLLRTNRNNKITPITWYLITLFFFLFCIFFQTHLRALHTIYFKMSVPAFKWRLFCYLLYPEHLGHTWYTRIINKPVTLYTLSSLFSIS